MVEEKSNYLGFCAFFLLIIVIVVVGSFMLYKSKQEKLGILKGKDVLIISDSKKQVKNKDFIYYDKEEVLGNELNIKIKYPVINLDSEDAKAITKDIEEYLNEVKGTLKYIKDGDVCDYGTSDNIAETKLLDYGIYNYQEYVTFFMSEYFYTCGDGVSPIKKLKAYTFNVLTGEKLSFNKLVEKFDLKMTDILSDLREHLEEIQVDDNIKIEETMRLLKENDTYIIYIDEDGKLLMKYIVKTNTVDYNDNIMLN